MMAEMCEYHLNGKTKEDFFLGNKYLFCEVCPKNCPYENSLEMLFEGELFGNICKSSGLAEKVEKIILPTKSA